MVTIAGSRVPLRSVKVDEKPARKKPVRTVVEAAENGSRRDLLVATRARVAKDIDNPNTPSRDLAALTRRLLEIAREIEAIDAKDRDDDIGTAAGEPDEEWSAI